MAKAIVFSREVWQNTTLFTWFFFLKPSLNSTCWPNERPCLSYKSLSLNFRRRLYIPSSPSSSLQRKMTFCYKCAVWLFSSMQPVCSEPSGSVPSGSVPVCQCACYECLPLPGLKLAAHCTGHSGLELHKLTRGGKQKVHTREYQPECNPYKSITTSVCPIHEFTHQLSCRQMRP